MQTNGINPVTRASDLASATAPIAPPSSDNVQAFNNIMQGQGTAGTDSCTACGDKSPKAGGKEAAGGQSMEQLTSMLQQLIQQLLALLKGGAEGGGGAEGKTHGGSSVGEGGGVKSVEGTGTGGSAGSSELIPPPTEHLQTLNLGGKPVTVGGDGSSSAAEVAATAGNIQNLYDNSPSFRNMIDSSSDPSFDVTVGKRPDNTSWGNTQGRVFMNLNNVAPTNSDQFQSLLGHEFAHASIDLGHGSSMEKMQDAVAQEA